MSLDTKERRMPSERRGWKAPCALFVIVAATTLVWRCYPHRRNLLEHAHRIATITVSLHLLRPGSPGTLDVTMDCLYLWISPHELFLFGPTTPRTFRPQACCVRLDTGIKTPIKAIDNAGWLFPLQ